MALGILYKKNVLILSLGLEDGSSPSYESCMLSKGPFSDHISIRDFYTFRSFLCIKLFLHKRKFRFFSTKWRECIHTVYLVSNFFESGFLLLVSTVFESGFVLENYGADIHWGNLDFDTGIKVKGPISSKAGYIVLISPVL